MSSYLDNVTVSHRFTRVRRIKTLLYFLQVVLVILASITLIYYDGARVNPVYLPSVRALYFLLLIMVVFNVENFFFRFLEIRYAYKDSHRFLLADSGIKGSRNTAILAALLALAFLLPAAKVIGEAALSKEAQATLDASQTYRLRFDNTDFLGITKSKLLRINVQTGTVRISVTRNGGSVVGGVVLTSGATWELPLSYDSFSSYVAQVDNLDSTFAATFTYTVVVGLPNDFGNFLALVAVLLLVSNIAFIVFLIPVRRRYAASSIYSRDYVQEAPPDENPWLPPRHPEERPWYEMRSEWSPAAAPWPTPAAGRRHAPPPPTDRIAEAPELPPAPDDESVPELVPPPPPPGFEQTPAAPVAQPTPSPPPAPGVPQGPPVRKEPRDVETVEYLLESAEKARLVGDQRAALAEYEKILARDRNNLQALQGKIEVLITLGRPSEALDALDRVLATDPNHQRALLAKGKLLEVRGQFDEALECYERVGKGKPEYVEALRRKGEVLQRLGEDDLALAALVEASSLAPGDKALSISVAKLKEALGKVPPTLTPAPAPRPQAPSPATAPRPPVPSAAPAASTAPKEGEDRRTLQELQGKGIGYLHVGMYKEALASFDSILAKDSRNVFAHVSKGKVLERMGLTENALTAYRNALTAAGPNGEILNALGELLLRLGREGEASGYLGQASDLNPKYEKPEEKIAKYKAAKAEMEHILGKLADAGVLKREVITALQAAGYSSLAALGTATVQELLTVKGVDTKAAQKILEESKGGRTASSDATART